MATALRGGGFGFWLDPKDVEPIDDPAWSLVLPSFRRSFWAEAARVAEAAWKAARAQGLDRYGRPMRPIHLLTMLARDADVNPVTASASA